METLKLPLAYSCQNSLKIEPMDVETAFFNGEIKSEVYVNQPLGLQNVTSQVYKLSKSMYGLREKPRQWYECFHQFMIELKFQRSKYDYCLYVRNDMIDSVYVIVLVDDLLIRSKNDRVPQ